MVFPGCRLNKNGSAITAVEFGRIHCSLGATESVQRPQPPKKIRMMAEMQPPAHATLRLAPNRYQHLQRRVHLLKVLLGGRGVGTGPYLAGIPGERDTLSPYSE